MEIPFDSEMVFIIVQIAIVSVFIILFIAFALMSRSVIAIQTSYLFIMLLVNVIMQIHKSYTVKASLALLKQRLRAEHYVDVLTNLQPPESAE